MDDAELIALLGEGAHGYFAGGAGDELTLRDNEASWSRIRLSPQVLVDVSSRDASVTVLGQRLPHPVVVAPMAYQRHAHEDGESGTARAAAATDSTFVLSSQSTTSIADVAAAAPDARRWFQLYVFKDRQVSLDLVAQAREHGYEALVVTVDFPVGGWRERDRRTGFSVTHPLAINPTGESMTTSELFAMHDPSLTWDDIGEFTDAAGMPLLLKGILRPDDAERAVDVGAAGIVVSNHGGRQLDTVLSGADALPPVVDAVAGRADVLVDGGIRRGWDVAKALCLGADAVLVGRPVLWGLAQNGQAGAEAVLTQLHDELDTTLALLGCPNARDLDASFLTR
ncbi:alpha-hydroxy acid oxidase [Aeromicrobium terrae]|uniref:Alpha-hydroxy-acid oxidizing protein n=1 Tax=Aeromicrobium terrae TaxID=2498846 RepID=A0A5C8NGS2_9ACTN|nr:alpha-hydroxy acid oxidase [Aeromicrobium terrae]TXL57758.1 alpha-hydroxy-acid oxidizing protein [Aeromicrobium terrae]